MSSQVVSRSTICDPSTNVIISIPQHNIECSRCNDTISLSKNTILLVDVATLILEYNNPILYYTQNT